MLSVSNFFDAGYANFIWAGVLLELNHQLKVVLRLTPLDSIRGPHWRREVFYYCMMYCYSLRIAI